MYSIFMIMNYMSTTPILSFRETMESYMSHFSKDVYRKPYCRIQPYLVGMVLGYMIFKSLGRKIRFRWVNIIFKFLVAFSFLCFHIKADTGIFLSQVH